MAVQVTNNSPQVENNIDNGIGLAIRFMLEDIYKEATPSTPMNTGDLRTRVLRTMEGNSKGVISWNSSYAEVQEKGYRDTKTGKRVYFKHYTTPNTGPHYASNAVKDIVENLPDYLEKANIL